jgi:hypothetical protein
LKRSGAILDSSFPNAAPSIAGHSFALGGGQYLRVANDPHSLPLGCGRTDGYVGPDLRWTAKTLITHAGVRPDIPERVLAHVIPRVEGIYDRSGYLPEKHDALTRLATLVDRIINPPADNIVRRAPAKRRHDTPLNPSGAG